MTDYLKISHAIKSEADNILNQHGLLPVLAKYGSVKFTGSYRLDLMMKKDLDISLVSESIPTEEFFNMGNEISSLLNPHSMFYRNTRIKHVENRPAGGLYWGIQFGEWNLDIWAIPGEEFERSEKYINGILSSLTKKNKTTILQLKYELFNKGLYGKTFSSNELYDSVINHKVNTVDDFNNYLKKSLLLERK